MKRIRKLAVVLILSGLGLAGVAAFAAEFEVLGKLSVDGYTVLRGSADIPGGLFAVGASTFVVKNGNVGIGTMSPGQKLEVAGNVLVNSSVADAAGATPSLNVFGAWLSIGDQGGAQTFANGLGIKFHDSGVALSSIRYVPSADRLDFCASSNSSSVTCDGTPALSVKTGTGNVGIGTTGPVKSLEVAGTGIKTTGGFEFSGGANNAGTIFTDTNWGGLIRGRSGTVADVALQDSAGNIALSVKSGGNVGIGTAGPTYLLDVQGTGSSTMRIQSNTASLNYLDIFNTNTGTTGNGSIIRLITRNASGTGDAVIDMVKYASGGFYINNSESTTGGGIGFGVGGTERLHIDSAGNVGIGAVNSSYKLNVSGAINATYLNGALRSLDIRTIAPNSETSGTMRFGFTSWNNNNGAPYADFLHMRSYTDVTGGNDNLLVLQRSAIAMRIYQQAFGSASAYSTYSDVNLTPGSDIRLKKNVKTIAGALDKALSLRGVNFEWNDIYLKHFGGDNAGLQMGLIAQEVEKVVPEVVTHDKLGLTGLTDVLSIDYSRLSALLIEAIKEQQGQIMSLSGQLASLSNSLQAELKGPAAGRGNVGIGTTGPTSKSQAVGLPEYAGNAAAIAAGLTPGTFYRTGEVVKVVY